MAGPIINIQIPCALSDLQIQALHVYLTTVASELEKRRPYARRNQRHHDRARDQRESLLVQLMLWQDEAENSMLKQHIALMQQEVQRKTHDYWEIGVSDGQQLGTSYPITNSLRKYGIDVQAYRPMHWDKSNIAPLELADWLHIMGSVPYYRVQVIVFDERIEDSLLGAYLIADMADELEGWVKLRVQPHFYTLRAEDAWTLDQTRELVASIEGRAHEIEYATPRGTSVYHIVDGEFLRNWAEHEQFHLRG